MKITLALDSGVRICALPYEGCEHVLPAGCCPFCGDDDWRVQGGAISHDRDTYRCQAWCLACGAGVGELRAKVSTIFGIEEDEAVLNSRCRVY